MIWMYMAKLLQGDILYTPVNELTTSLVAKVLDTIQVLCM